MKIDGLFVGSLLVGVIVGYWLHESGVMRHG